MSILYEIVKFRGDLNDYRITDRWNYSVKRDCHFGYLTASISKIRQIFLASRSSISLRRGMAERPRFI